MASNLEVTQTVSLSVACESWMRSTPVAEPKQIFKASLNEANQAAAVSAALVLYHL